VDNYRSSADRKKVPLTLAPLRFWEHHSLVVAANETNQPFPGVETMQANELTFGVEIECYAPTSVDLTAALVNAGVQVSQAYRTHDTTPGWKIVHDGSLGSRHAGMIGREVVSPILRGEDGLRQVAAVARALDAAGCKVDRTCGLHVHVGAQNATPAQIKNVVKMFAKYEHHFDALCPESRRNNNFCRSNRDFAGGIGSYESQVATIFEKLDGTRSVRGIASVINGGYGGHHYSRERYFKLNLQSMASHGTIEFRQQAGTINAQKMTSWIKLVTGFVAAGFTLKSVSSQASPSFAKLLRKVDRETAAFLQQRRTALNRGVTLPE
jgi:hypothetical protein